MVICTLKYDLGVDEFDNDHRLKKKRNIAEDNVNKIHTNVLVFYENEKLMALWRKELCIFDGG